MELGLGQEAKNTRKGQTNQDNEAEKHKTTGRSKHGMQQKLGPGNELTDRSHNRSHHTEADDVPQFV